MKSGRESLSRRQETGKAETEEMKKIEPIALGGGLRKSDVPQAELLVVVKEVEMF